MTPDQITQLHHLLKSILLIYGGNNHQLGEWTKEALALLPCETCNGTGKVPKHDGKPCSPSCQGHRTHPCEVCGHQWDGPMDCPDCQ